jgi:hypothetical protein
MTTRPGTCRGGAFAYWHPAWPQPLIYRSRVRQQGHGKRLDGGRLPKGCGRQARPVIRDVAKPLAATQRPNPPAAAPRGARLSALRGRHGRVGTDTRYIKESAPCGFNSSSGHSRAALTACLSRPAMILSRHLGSLMDLLKMLAPINSCKAKASFFFSN